MLLGYIRKVNFFKGFCFIKAVYCDFCKFSSCKSFFGVKFSIAEISILKGAGQNVGTFLAAIQKKVAARS